MPSLSGHPIGRRWAGRNNSTTQQNHTFQEEDMTQQDDWQREMARLAQRQDQLERQHRETTTRVDTLKRDADASKMDVDSRMDSLRREMDWQFRSREWRVKSLERFRDFIESLIMYVILIGCAVALVVSLVIITIEARGASQESEQPEERSLSSMEAPWLPLGGRANPVLSPVGHISTASVAHILGAIDIRRSLGKQLQVSMAVLLSTKPFFRT